MWHALLSMQIGTWKGGGVSVSICQKVSIVHFDCSLNVHCFCFLHIHVSNVNRHYARFFPPNPRTQSTHHCASVWMSVFTSQDLAIWLYVECGFRSAHCTQTAVSTTLPIHWDRTKVLVCRSLGSRPTQTQELFTLVPRLFGTTYYCLSIQPFQLLPSRNIWRHTSLWRGLSPIDTGTPNGPLMLRNCFIKLAVAPLSLASLRILAL